MKKLFIISAVLILGTLATWAQVLPGLSFTIYPESSGEFTIYYTTYGAPKTGNVVWVKWAGGAAEGYELNNNGSNPNKGFSGIVTKGKPITIYSDYLDAIEINDRAEAIRCESNNPQLQYIYYLKDNLNSQALEVLYYSLADRSSKSAWGELYLSQTTAIASAGDNILKSNAFAAIARKWEVCSMKDYKGNKFWKLDENNCKNNLIPAIYISKYTTSALMTMDLGIMTMPEYPLDVPTSFVRIDDGTNNHKSVSVNIHTNLGDMLILNRGSSSIKIYGALVSFLNINSLSKITKLDFSNTTNLRFISGTLLTELTSIINLNGQVLLEEFYLFSATSLTSIDLSQALNLKVLRLEDCSALKSLTFNTQSLKSLSFEECIGLLGPSSLIGDLANATKLKGIKANNLGWDACQINELYGLLKSNPPFGATICVDNNGRSTKSNDFSRSNHSIATNKGWQVYRVQDGKTVILEGDGGGCSFTLIPDANFLQALKTLGHGAGADGNKVPTANLSAITTLDVSNKNISDLTGIQDFVALDELNCNSNKLKALDVSKNTKLTTLYCNFNQLSTLDVSKSKALLFLECDRNKLSILDLSKNTALTKFYCNNNELTSLDIRNGNNANVNYFEAYNNPNLTCILVDNKAASYLTKWEKNASTKWANNESECGETVAYTNIPDNNFLNALIALGHGDGAVGNKIPTANLSAIDYLDVSDKNISDLSGIQDFVALTKLWCSENNLTSLDVSKNTALTHLWCNDNDLTRLDVSNSALLYLRCYANDLKTLDVSNNTKLVVLYCYGNEISTLDVSQNTALAGLACDSNKLTSLDVSKNTELIEFYCNNNQLTVLDVRNGNNSNFTTFEAHNNPNLSCIYVDNKAASYLSLWKKDATTKFVTTESECGATVAYTLIPDNNFLQALKTLGHGAGAVGNNVPTANLKTIKSLDVSNKNIKDLTGIQDFVALTELDCSFNELLSLDVSANKLLTNLSCYSTGLTSLNVSANKLLTNLSCSSNKLKNLDVSKNTALVYLNCGGNQLSTLNLSSNIALGDLSCEGNNLSSLDLSSNKALTYLECSGNQLKSLNVSKCAGLSILSCYSNKLEVLNLSANTALTYLECYHNALTSLDLSKNTALTNLECSSNKLITLDIRNGNNDKITDFAASSNPNLTCIYVNNKAASYLSGWLKDATTKFVTTESECTTSVSDFKEQDISMYPNPTNGILNFDFSGKKVQSIKISDVVGRTVFEKNNPNQREAIDLSAFVSGIYMVTLQMDKENRSFKIIKQ